MEPLETLFSVERKMQIAFEHYSGVAALHLMRPLLERPRIRIGQNYCLLSQ